MRSAQHHDNSRFEGSYRTSATSTAHSNSVHPHQQHVIHQQHSLDPMQMPMYYNLQRQEMVSNAHQINSTAQTSAPHSVYANTAPYGSYTAIQYHHQSSPPHYHHHPNQLIIQAHDLSRYVSTIPVQGPIPAQVPANGAFIYFQQPTNAPTINVMNSIDNNKSLRSPTKGAGKSSNNGKKNGRGKINGSSDPNGKVISDMLEEFRSEKNQSKNAFDVKGKLIKIY